MITEYFDGIELKFASESQRELFYSLPVETQETLAKEYQSRY